MRDSHTLYGDIDRLRRFNRALGGDGFLEERGYSSPRMIPDELKALSFPARSPLPFIAEENGALLDIGCGAGMDIFVLADVKPRLRVTGLERSEPLLSVARRHTGSPLIAADAALLPFRSSAFDGVILNGVFNLVSDRESLISECSRVTAERGFIFIADIYLKARGIKLPDDSEQFSIKNALPVKDIFTLLRNHGYDCGTSRFEPDYTREFGIFAMRWSKR